ncbi:MAG: hypothetical protein IPG44_17900 [Anaerolineales bacterium]|nr:hypothetical protein [Anaerolineales bacterium]
MTSAAALSAYQPVELTPAEIAKRGSLLYLFTDLIYVEYKDGVRDGQITAIEYQEAVTSGGQAEVILKNCVRSSSAADANAAARLEAILGELETASRLPSATRKM